MQRERQGLMSDFLGGRMFPSLLFGGKRNPFDDPFFSRPFAGGAHEENNKEKGIAIEELDSDHEELDSKPSKEPSVEHPDDDDDDDDVATVPGWAVAVADGKSKVEGATETRSNRSFNVHTCKVTYGGVNGAYYTSTRTTKAGSDGVVIEETKEADRTTGQAQHRISRGIHNKGHSVTRKLNGDGKVNTLHTLHNLNEDELAGFEEAWKSNNRGDFLGWNNGFNPHGSWGSEQRRETSLGDWFRPSSEEIVQRGRWMGPENEARSGGHGRTKKVVRINIE